MQLSKFLNKLSSTPELIDFDETIAVIDQFYRFTPVEFVNGDLVNKAGQNIGSCKILAFGKLHGLPESEVLACFGKFYREDVLKNPQGNDHLNIRNFSKSGWRGVSFARLALSPKNANQE